MTSSSLRKRRTTPRSTSRGSDRSLAAAAIAIAALLAAAPETRAYDWRTLEQAATRQFDDAQTATPEAPVTTAEGRGVDEGGVVAVSGKDVCEEEGKNCDEALRKLRADHLAGIDLDIRVGGRAGNDYPCECRLEGQVFEPRRFATTTFTWKAAGYCHKPLYFEDWNLERYGHSHGWADPVVSAAHFFVTLPVLPYKMGVELPWECVYPLGYYRPGNCAPWTCPAVPISYRGMAVQAATVTGLVFLLP
jgi:hypothetical protein